MSDAVKWEQMKISSNPSEHLIFKTPKSSEWKCYLFGNTPCPDGSGLIYIPTEGNVPNRFVRWMMKICFGCTWIKEESE